MPPDAWRLHVRHVHVMPRVRGSGGHLLRRLVEPDPQCLQTNIWRRIRHWVRGRVPDAADAADAADTVPSVPADTAADTAPDAWRLHGVRHVHVMPRVRDSDGHLLQRLVEPDAQCLQTRIWRRILRWNRSCMPDDLQVYHGSVHHRSYRIRSHTRAMCSDVHTAVCLHK
jgi:hypothetical protein